MNPIFVTPETSVRHAKPTGWRKDVRCTVTGEAPTNSPMYCIEMQGALDPMDLIFALIRKSAN